MRRGAAELHNRASLWYEENGYEAVRFHHAVAVMISSGRQPGRDACRPWITVSNLPAWLGWVKKLPDKLNPRQACAHGTQVAQALMDAGE